MQNLNICIVGCGGYAYEVMNEIKGVPGIKFSFASRDISKAKSYQGQFDGAHSFGSYEEAASHPEIDAMYIFSPHNLHLHHTTMALSNKKHVLVEKPIAKTLEEGKKMIALANNSGIHLMVAENYKFLPTVEKSAEIIRVSDESGIGRLRTIKIISETYREPEGWRRELKISGGGVFIDAGIHLVNLLVNLAGFPEKISAVIPPSVFHESEGEDALNLFATYSNGVSGTIFFSRSTDIGKPVQEIQIDGSAGRIQFNPFSNDMKIVKGNLTRTIKLKKSKRGSQEMISSFRDLILHENPNKMSGEMGLDDLSIVMSAYESANTGSEVTPVKFT